jgi:hypothetical protein
VIRSGDDAARYEPLRSRAIQIRSGDDAARYEPLRSRAIQI